MTIDNEHEQIHKEVKHKTEQKIDVMKTKFQWNIVQSSVMPFFGVTEWQFLSADDETVRWDASEIHNWV